MQKRRLAKAKRCRFFHSVPPLSPLRGLWDRPHGTADVTTCFSHYADCCPTAGLVSMATKQTFHISISWQNVTLEHLRKRPVR